MLLFKFIVSVLLLQFATCQFPGPQKTTDQNGNEIWEAQGEPDGPTFTYTVRDLGRMRPTLVYNCAEAPSLCRTVQKYWGSQTQGQFHYDKDFRIKTSNSGRDGMRKTKRRSTNCPKNWKETHYCPEQGQPQYQARGMGWTTAENWKGLWGDEQETVGMLAIKDGVVHNSDGTQRQKWKRTGLQMTCDEWPAASWIEGGIGGATNCVPQGVTCKNKQGNVLAKAGVSEQNWQGDSHNGIGNWVNRHTPNQYKTGHQPDWTIYKFDFKLVDDPNTKYATWVEANGNKRYCFGPHQKNNADCKIKWPGD